MSSENKLYRAIERAERRVTFERCQHTDGTYYEGLGELGYRLRCNYCGKVMSTFVYPAPECACKLPDEICSICSVRTTEEIPF